MKPLDVTSVHCLNLPGFIRNQVWIELYDCNMESDISKAFGLGAEDPWPVSYCGGMETEFLLPEDLTLLISMWNIFLEMQKITSPASETFTFFFPLFVGQMMEMYLVFNFSLDQFSK